MPPDIVGRLAERGRCAGAALASRYTTTSAGIAVSWDNQRWVRYRSSLASLQPLLRQAVRAYRGPAPAPDRDYALLVQRGEHDLPEDYRWDERQQASAIATMQALDMLVDAWERVGRDFDARGPFPLAELRVAPPE